MCIQNLKFLALRGTQKISAVPGYALAASSPKFLIGFCSNGPSEFTGQIWILYSFTRFWDNSDCSFGVELRTPDLGEEETVGVRGWYRLKERWWVPIGPPFMVTFPLSSHVSEILPLLCSSMPRFQTPSNLPQISPCSPVSRWRIFGLGRAKMLGYVSMQLLSKISNLCDRDLPTLQTDIQTDRRHAIAIPRCALHVQYIAR